MCEQHFEAVPGHRLQICLGIVSSAETAGELADLLADRSVRDRLARAFAIRLRRELEVVTRRPPFADVVWVDPRNPST